jgi:hypothetical protein
MTTANIKETQTIKYTPSLFWLKKDAFLEATETEMVERFEKRLPTYEVMDDEAFQYSLYVDTETTAVSRENYTEQLCKTFETKIEDYIREALIELMGAGFEPNITIATSHTANYKEDQTKISLHLHVSNVIATKQQQRRFIHQMNLMSFANKSVPYNIFDYIPAMECLFDESVYSVERKMRCVNTSKPNECRPLILVKGNLINTIITRHDPDARVMEDFNDGPVYTKSNFVSPFDNGITESTYNEELLFYAESGAFANMVGSGCHQKWLSLAGMLVSILPVEDAFNCWEQATIRDGTINKQCEYEAKFNHVKKLMDDPLKAMNSLKKTIKYDYPTIAQEWKQRANIAKETAKQQLCDAVKAQKEAIKVQRDTFKQIEHELKEQQKQQKEQQIQSELELKEQQKQQKEQQRQSELELKEQQKQQRDTFKQSELELKEQQKQQRDTFKQSELELKEQQKQQKEQQRQQKDQTKALQLEYIEKRRNENIFVDCDNEACDVMTELLGDKLIFVGDRFYYKQGHVWINNVMQIDALLLVFVAECRVYKQNLICDLKPYGQNTKTALNICKLIYAKVRINPDCPIKYSWFHSSTRKKLCFEDGVLDFKMKTFTLWENLKEPIYTTTIIKRPYANYFNEPNREMIDNVRDNIFKVLFGDRWRLALQFFGRAIAGCNQDKNFMSYSGKRDCGKGVLFDGFKSAFENYVSSFNLENMLCRRESSKGSDLAKENSWLMEFEFTRIAIAQETDHNENGNIKQSLKVSNKMLKSVMSGGDELEGRQLYQQATKFTIDATIAMLGNNELSITGDDSAQHHLKFMGVKSFVTQADYDSKKAEFGDDFISAYIVRDDDLKDNIKNRHYGNAMVYLLLEYYTDSCIAVVLAENDDEATLELSVRDLIFKHYELTKNGDDRVSKDDLFQIIGKDKKKITAELKQLGCWSEICKMTIQQETESGEMKPKQVPAFKGLKLRSTEEESNSVECDM